MGLVSNNPEEDIAPLFGDPDFGIEVSALEELKGSSADIVEVNDNKSLKVAQAALTKLVSTRTWIDSKRKELKAPAIEYGKMTESKAKSLLEILKPEEDRLRALVDAEKKRKAEAKRIAEEAEKERVDAILARIEKIRDLPLSLASSGAEDIASGILLLDAMDISESIFEEYLSQATMVHAKVSAAMDDLFRAAQVREAADSAAKAELDRIAKQEAEAKAEREAAEAKQREEAEAKAKQVAEEQAKVKAEQEAEAKRLADKQAEIDAQRKAIEDKEKAEAESERLKAEAEEAAAEAARLAPEQEKLQAYLDALLKVEAPELEHDSYVAAVNRVVNAINKEILF